MNTFFYDTIYQLRTNEEIILFDKVLDFKIEDESLVNDFLQIEWESEILNFPFDAPHYDAKAALWAAKTVYTSCQILLYREHKIEELPNLLPPFSGEVAASQILSADLCLRFLPQILAEARAIDAEDPLIILLENILIEWHYSGVGENNNIDNLDFNSIFNSPCLKQLYIDRVIEKKDLKRALLPELYEKIKAIMGDYNNYFWKNLKTLNL